MSESFSDKAIILRRVNVGEADRILSILTESHGKISVRAKSVRKLTSKLAGAVEPFCYSELHLVQGKKYATLAGAKIINMYARAREDFEKLTLSCEFIEVVERNLHDGLAHKEVFGLLKNSLEFLDSNNQLSIINHKLRSYFILNFLKNLGYEPQLGICAHCHEKIEAGRQLFSFAHGGLLCGKCDCDDFEALEISVDLVKVLRLFLSSDISIISRLKLDQVLQGELIMISNGLLSYRLEPAKKVDKFKHLVNSL